MSYLVTSPLVLVKVPDQVGDGYRVDYHYQGSVIPWLSDEQTEHFLAEGLVVEVDGDSPPAKTALKEDWVAFAVTKGADEAEAEGLTKQELQDLYGE